MTRSIGIQLYSARQFPPVTQQLATIRSAGFTHVEPFAPFYDDVEGTKRLLAQNGLSAHSGHFALALAEREPERVIDISHALGIGIVVLPYLVPDERPTDAAGWAALGKRLDAVARRMSAAGLRTAWHNHDFEFVALPDGSRPIEHLLGDALLWEADLAWVVKGGADPAGWVTRYSGRIPLVHIKDIAPAGSKADEDGWADVGAGVLPWGDLWRRCVEAGAETMIAEHDNPSSFERFATASAAAMRRFEGESRP